MTKKIEKAQAILIMGVSGSGKSTVAEDLAKAFDWQYFDADDFHPEANVNKMAQGIPLEDSDRWPWLESLQKLIVDNLSKGQSCTLACSALKKSYRDLLRQDNDLEIVYLKGDFELILQRMKARKDHFMKDEMLKSQFATLEEPTLDEVNIVSIDGTPEEILNAVISELDLD